MNTLKQMIFFKTLQDFFLFKKLVAIEGETPNTIQFNPMYFPRLFFHMFFIQTLLKPLVCVYR